MGSLRRHVREGIVIGSGTAWLHQVVLHAGLNGSPAAGPLVLDPVDWEELLGWARRERVTGLLHSAAASWRLTDRQRAELSREHQLVLARTLRVESSLVPVAEAFAAAGVEWRLLKGVVTSRLLYPEAGSRSFVDIDVLVRPEDAAETLRALAPLTSEGPAPLAGRARERVRKELTVVDRRGVEIDIHQGVEGSLLASRLPIDPFFEGDQRIDVRGVEMRFPPMSALFVHATLHSTSVNGTASSWADVARLAHITRPDDAVFGRLVERRGARDLFVWSLQRVGTAVRLPERWLGYCNDNRLPPGVRSFFEWAHRDPVRIAAVNLVTPGDALRRVVETLWPARSFLDEEGTTRVENLRRLYRKAFR